MFDSGSGANVQLCMSLAHPWASDCLLKSSTEAGYGAERREEKKDAKYGNKLYLGAMTPAFIPLAMKHFGS